MVVVTITVTYKNKFILICGCYNSEFDIFTCFVLVVVTLPDRSEDKIVIIFVIEVYISLFLPHTILL